LGITYLGLGFIRGAGRFIGSYRIGRGHGIAGAGGFGRGAPIVARASVHAGFVYLSGSGFRVFTVLGVLRAIALTRITGGILLTPGPKERQRK
jgi:hypothetical protein